MGRDPKRPDSYAIPEGALVALRRPDVKRGGVWEAAVFEAPFVIDDKYGAVILWEAWRLMLTSPRFLVQI